jgi:nucleolar GTP-binding protein
MDGKNIADFIDPDIEERLLALEAEEEALIAAEGEEGAIIPEDDPEQKALLRAVRDKKKLVVLGSRRDHGKNRPSLPRTTPGIRPSKAEAKAHFEAIGLGASVDRVLRHATGEDETAGKRRGRSESRGRKAAAEDEDGDVAMGGAGSGAESSHVKRGRSRSLKVRSRHDDADEDMGSPRPRSRSRSRTGAPPEVAPKEEGLKDAKQKFQLRKLLKKIQKKEFNGTQGETDRRILAKRPKHLFSGKRGIGSSDWR